MLQKSEWIYVKDLQLNALSIQFHVWLVISQQMKEAKDMESWLFWACAGAYNHGYWGITVYIFANEMIRSRLNVFGIQVSMKLAFVTMQSDL